jgi:hypothetical protein
MGSATPLWIADLESRIGIFEKRSEEGGQAEFNLRKTQSGRRASGIQSDL